MHENTHFLIDCQKFDLQRTDLVSFTTTNGIVLNLQSVLKTENAELIKLVNLFQEQRQLSKSFCYITKLGYIMFNKAHSLDYLDLRD
jgi:hypothetical protein